MRSKMLSKVVIITMLIFVFACNGVLAISFKDQSDIDKLPWAKDAIMNMAERGIISGMGDGTFKPADNIKKLDCLMLFSKALGSINPQYEAELAAAEEQYRSYLNSYLIYGKKEISYLLKKGVLKTDELANYIGANSAYSSILRYEAAILLVKVMGQEQAVKDSIVSTVRFTDQDLIPERARPYVDFLYQLDIMKGTSDTQFSPNIPVTRAQMAVLLYKASAKFGQGSDSRPVIQGVISRVESDLNLVTIKHNVGGAETSYSVSTAKITVDGVTRTIGSLSKGMTVSFVIDNNKVVELSAKSPVISEGEKGIVSGIQTSGSIKKIKVKVDNKGSLETKEYIIGSDTTIIRDGIEISNAGIKINDYAIIEIADDGTVYRLTLEGKEKEVKGTVIAITTELPASITIEKGEDQYTYPILSTVTIKRNNRAGTIWDVRVGDTVTLTLYYDEIKEILATGKRTQHEGVLEEMIISRNPQITILRDGQSEKFDVAINGEVTIDGEQKTFYDLRVGYKLLLKLESNTVVAVIAEQTKQAQQITGTIDQINESIGVVSIITTDSDASGMRQLYFPRETTVKVINAFTGRILSTKDLRKGQKITAFGYSEMGIFVTTQITIIEE